MIRKRLSERRKKGQPPDLLDETVCLVGVVGIDAPTLKEGAPPVCVI